VDDGSSLVLLGVCGFVCVAAGLVAIVGLLLLRATGRGASAILSDLPVSYTHLTLPTTERV